MSRPSRAALALLLAGLQALPVPAVLGAGVSSRASSSAPASGPPATAVPGGLGDSALTGGRPSPAVPALDAPLGGLRPGTLALPERPAALSPESVVSPPAAPPSSPVLREAPALSRAEPARAGLPRPETLLPGGREGAAPPLRERAAVSAVQAALELKAALDAGRHGEARRASARYFDGLRAEGEVRAPEPPPVRAETPRAPRRPRLSFLPAIDAPEELSRVSPVSVRRAYRHSFGGWNEESVLEVPLTAADHWVLAGGTALLTSLLFVLPALQVAVAPSVLGALFMLLQWGGGVVGFLGLGGGHVREGRDAAAVARNARDFRRGAVNGIADARLVRKARDFEEELARLTGASGRRPWKVLWTDAPHLLARVDRASRSVVLSVGWVNESPRPRDRRRLAYLTDTLRKIRRSVLQSESR